MDIEKLNETAVGIWPKEIYGGPLTLWIYKTEVILWDPSSS